MTSGDASENAPDEDAFIAACLQIAKPSGDTLPGAAARARRAQDHAAPSTAPTRTGNGLSPAKPPGRADTTELRQLNRSFEATIEELRIELAESQSAIASLRRTINAMTTEREADLTGIRDANHREAEVVAELRSLRDELARARNEQADTSRALDTAIKRADEATGELSITRAAASNHAAAAERLRREIADRDRVAEELRAQLLRAEEARAADAAAFLESLNLEPR